MKGNEFKKAKTIPEIGLISQRLKEAGEDPLEVNRLASIRKRELVMVVNKVNSLEKQVVRASAIPKYKHTHLTIKQGESLSDPMITVTSEMEVTI